MADGIRGLAQQEFELDLRRREVAQTDEERALLAHVRQWCHNGAICPLCKAQNQVHEERQRADAANRRYVRTQRFLDSIVEG